jgi:hypothetical protein
MSIEPDAIAVYQADFQARLAGADKALTDPAVYARAADILEQGGGLVRGVFAATAPETVKGTEPVNIEDPRASCFCIMGAVVRAGIELGHIEPKPEPGGRAGWTDGDSIGFRMVQGVTQALWLPCSANRWSNHDAKNTAEVVAALRGADVTRVHSMASGRRGPN